MALPLATTGALLTLATLAVHSPTNKAKVKRIKGKQGLENHLTAFSELG
jgi:chromosome segregation and condensation protein ScpB